MTSGGAYLSLKCSSATCGARYPSPPDDARFGTCPICESSSESVGAYPPSIDHRRAAADRGELVAVVDNVRSAMNVGTILRTADGVQASHVYLCGITAAADHPKVAKAALGADRVVSSSWEADATDRVRRLRDQGYRVWALEATYESVPLDELMSVPPKVALVVGNERAGVDPELLNQAERHIHLGMGGSKTSLNVGVAFGAAAYWLQAMPVSDRTAES